VLFLFNYSSAQENIKFYAFNKDWSNAKNLNSAPFFMASQKINDTLYTCRYYNKYGPMINFESYRDSSLEIPNGLFAWYNTEGHLDSIGEVNNGKKIGEWSYKFSDSGTVLLKGFYEYGKLKKTINYQSKQVIFPNGNIENLTEDIEDSTDRHKAEFPGGISNWTHYLEKNLVTPERLLNTAKPYGKHTVVVGFSINKVGEISDISIVKSCEWDADREVIRIIKEGPKWIPATIKGNPVVYRHQQSITFIINRM
jgi:protein TonB